MAAQAASVQASDRAVFLNGNISFVLYHEFGHAMIREFGLNLYGREEDAVDNLSALFMLPEEPDLLADDLVMAAVKGWQILDQSSSNSLGGHDSSGFGSYALEHSPDRVRALNILCVLYGSDPDGFAALAKSAGLREEKFRYCQELYEETLQGWAKKLGPYVRSVPPDGGGDWPDGKVPGKIRLHFEDPGDSRSRSALKSLRSMNRIEGIITLLDRGFQWGGQVDVIFRDCNAATAWWDDENREMVVCYELLTLYDRLYQEKREGGS